MFAPQTRASRLSTIAFATVARFLLNGRSAGHGENAQLAAAATHRTRGSEKAREVNAIEAAHLREKIGATDQILGRRHAD